MEGERARHLDNIIPIWSRASERINGVDMRLGKMSLEQLVSLEDALKNHILEAQTDLWVVSDYRQRLYPDGDTAA